MSAQPTSLHPEIVTATDTAVHVGALTETHADVVRVVADADDPVEAVHNCLRIGATALRVANTAVDVDMVQRTFDEMASRFDAQVSAAVDEIRATTEGFLATDDGTLHVALGSFRSSLDELLGATFDPDSKKSVVSTIEALVGEVVKSAVDGVRNIVEPTGDDSPLARLKADIVKGLQGELTSVGNELRVVSERLGIAAAVAEERERGTQKGMDFEESVDAVVAELASVYGDAHERTGNEIGATGGKVGDEVVSVNRDDTNGRAGAFVLEVKSGKVAMRKIQDELDRAMANRSAVAAIAVFKRQADAPTRKPFHFVDDKAFVVFDDADGDDGALRLAYMWARWIVRRKLSPDATDAIDHERVKALLGDAERAVERVTTIRRYHSTAQKSIEQAAGEIDLLADEVRTALDRVGRELRETA